MRSGWVAGLTWAAVALTATASLAQEPAGNADQKGCRGGPAPYICVAAVRVKPGTIHRTLNPNTGTLTVTIRSYGRLPRGATATVEVDTYSSLPIGNNVRYSPPQTVRLKQKLTTVRFSLFGSESTMTGSVIVASSIRTASAGIKFVTLTPGEESRWRTTFRTLAP